MHASICKGLATCSRAALKWAAVARSEYWKALGKKGWLRSVWCSRSPSRCGSKQLDMVGIELSVWGYETRHAMQAGQGCGPSSTSKAGANVTSLAMFKTMFKTRYNIVKQYATTAMSSAHAPEHLDCLSASNFEE